MSKSPLTVVMYHYVRPINLSKYPRIRGLETNDFEGQLDYLQEHYTLVTAAQVIAASRGEMILPDSPLLLTFDDGYKDHLNAARILKRRGLSGAFFPPAAVVLEKKVLDVNKLHFILAQVPNTETLVHEIEDALKSAHADHTVSTVKEYRARYWHKNRFDPADVNYVKRMLQVGLPAAMRKIIVDALFKRYVSEDEVAFAEELYLSKDDLREMLADGMEIGSHGYEHHWLNSLNACDQSLDLNRSLDFLVELGVNIKDFLFCYPYGAYNQNTLQLLKNRGCGAAFTTKVNLMNIKENILEIPRLDTNDLPKVRLGAISNWTSLAKKNY